MSHSSGQGDRKRRPVRPVRMRFVDTPDSGSNGTELELRNNRRSNPERCGYVSICASCSPQYCFARKKGTNNSTLTGLTGLADPFPFYIEWPAGGRNTEVRTDVLPRNGELESEQLLQSERAHSNQAAEHVTRCDNQVQLVLNDVAQYLLDALDAERHHFPLHHRLNVELFDQLG
jgi:hypothetical protein